MTITAIGAALIFLCLWLQSEIRHLHKNDIIKNETRWNDERSDQIIRMGEEIIGLRREMRVLRIVARQLAKHVPLDIRAATEIRHEWLKEENT